MPKVKPGQSRKGKNKATTASTRSKTGLSLDKEAELVKQITESVIGSLQQTGNWTNNSTQNTEDNSSDITLNNAEGILNDDMEGVTPIAIGDNIWQENELFHNTGAISTPISALIDAKIKQQIWEDKFIDLAILLPQNSTFESKRKGLQFQIVANSTLAVVPNKPKFAIYNIDTWTTAFLRYVAIYAEKYPEQVPHLIKHAELVRDLASSNSSNAWFTYDQKYRMDRQVRGVPWGVFNMEFYIMATRTKDTQGSPSYGNRSFCWPFRGQFKGPNRQFGNPPLRSGRQNDFGSNNRFGRGYCWAFNREGFCRVPSCKFTHKCSGCGNDHPVFRCTKQNATKQPNTNKPPQTKK